MPTLTRGLGRGLAAGAVGTTVLDTVTYLDMALSGRPASDAPAETVGAAADLVGLDVPDHDEALGALAGIATGLGVGVVAGLVRSSGVRLPLLVEAAVIGVGAMAATDGAMTVLDVTDPTTWSSTDWARDVVPHLVYGAAVAATLRGLEPDRAEEPAPRPAARPGRSLARSLAIGVASGARSTLGLVPPALATGAALPAATAGGLVAVEMGVDKLPATPSRLGGGTVARVGTGALGAATLARRDRVGVLPAAAAGAVGAVVGAVVGSLWREACAQRSRQWQGALAEDAVAVALTAWAVRA
jgi:uncharacterized membrane protein YeaQ/YmgE (transglycosylase-associated protein family)